MSFHVQHLEQRLTLHGLGDDVTSPPTDVVENTGQPAAIGSPYYSVVGGESSQPEAWPWIVSLQDTRLGHFCGGALVSSDMVATAAHCVVGSRSATVDAVIGVTDLSTSGGQPRDISEIVVHPDYDDDSLDADIAILRLTSPSTETPIALARRSQQSLFGPGVDAIILGWGELSEGGMNPHQLQQAQLPIIDNVVANSRDIYDGEVTDNMLTAGLSGGGVDSCQGDSGGPLIVSDGQGGHLLAGIVSWGEGCGRPNRYGVYTRVASYADWVDSFVPSSQGKVTFGSPRYSVDERITITLRDIDLVGTESAEVAVTSQNGDRETIELMETSTGTFSGSMYLSLGLPIAGNGTIEVKSRDILRATYEDVNDGSGNAASTTDMVRVTTDDHGNDSIGASEIKIDSQADGEIERHGDADWFQFRAVANTQYRFDVALGSLQDSVIRLYGQDGRTVFAENDDGGSGLGSRLFWTAPTSGPVFLEVLGFGSNVGSYQLQIQEADTVDDHASDAQSALHVPINSTTDGNIEIPGDVDWFEFDTVAGNFYVVTALQNELSDSFLKLFDQDGLTELTSDDDGGPDTSARIVWRAPTNGRYYIEVSGFGDEDTGTYQLEITDDVPPDDHGDDASAATPTDVHGVIPGQIGVPGDTDWFRFLAIAGSRYTFTGLLDELADSIVTLYDATGTTMIGQDDDGGPGLAGQIEWTAPATGTYYLSVAAFEDGVGTYQLQIDASLSFNPLPGDANRDGQFDRLDIIRVLQAGKYSTGEPASWFDGDWNGDGAFDQLDLVAALQTGDYLQGPYAARSTSG